MTYEKDKDPYWDPIYILEWSIPGQLFTEKIWYYHEREKDMLKFAQSRKECLKVIKTDLYTCKEKTIWERA